LPLVEGEVALAAIYGLAGLGVAAFTPSALSLVGDAAAPGRAGHAYAWYSTAHYGAIGVGPFVGGVVAEWWGYRAAFLASAVVIAIALVVAIALPLGSAAPTTAQPRATFADIRRNASVWAGWVVAASGMLIQGVVFTFFPLLGDERGLTPSAIGTVFLVLGLVNTMARFPAGWLVDRTGRPAVSAVAGVLIASLATALLPHASSQMMLLVLVAVFGAVTGLVGVATGVASPPRDAGRPWPRDGWLQHGAVFRTWARIVCARACHHTSRLFRRFRRGRRRRGDRCSRCRRPVVDGRAPVGSR
jgi:predicted MFS family arabinose efflux permease